MPPATTTPPAATIAAPATPSTVPPTTIEAVKPTKVTPKVTAPGDEPKVAAPRTLSRTEMELKAGAERLAYYAERAVTLAKAEIIAEAEKLESEAKAV